MIIANWKMNGSKELIEFWIEFLIQLVILLFRLALATLMTAIFALSCWTGFVMLKKGSFDSEIKDILLQMYRHQKGFAINVKELVLLLIKNYQSLLLLHSLKINTFSLSDIFKSLT